MSKTQLVSSGALCPNKPAKNEHLGSDLPFASISVPAASVAQGGVTVRCRWRCLFRIGVMQPKKREASGGRSFDILDTFAKVCNSQADVDGISHLLCELS